MDITALYFNIAHILRKISIISQTVPFTEKKNTGRFSFSRKVRITEKLPNSEEDYARNSEWLLHEAFCLYSERDIFDPYEKHHSTVKDACELAEKLQVRNLLLYHTEDRNLKERKRLYHEEGARYYHGNLFIPDDLETVPVTVNRL